MTFAQFQASGQDTDDIGLEIEANGMDGIAGRVYAGMLYIEDTTSWKDDRFPGTGRWYTIIGREEYSSDDLATIERELFLFAVAEGITV